MDSKISVIVPIYNVEKYLHKCIQSIINQSYKHLEIILVNDGSPDNCGKICDSYTLKDSRIHVIHKKNGGLSDARNTGLDYATGDYISFIDSDDFIHNKFYENLLSLILSEQADIAQCGFIAIKEDTKEKDLVNINPKKHKVIKLNNMMAIENLYNDNSVYTVVVWNKLYKRELFEKIRFPIGKINEDEYTTYQVFYNAAKIILTNQPLYFYLKRSTSIMGNQFNIQRLQKLEAISNQINFFNEKNEWKIRDMAIQMLETYVRSYIIQVIKSNLENKENILQYLFGYYSENFKWFKLCSRFNLFSKCFLYVINYFPNNLTKWTIKLLLRIKQIGLRMKRIIN
ncbi:glycosyltransferase [Caldibacillus lycopersici]|uniref:Glycosyltransferase n=1 Tax=Perspicuibacillus lycopersici TaxID=1325689 RepID=A0AAE3IPR5_9BACI|nr:glycosyltransferase [Perspicuibacillus lycopersici]MCU9612323.1 glycosyltransferase [Perspicuibacillus lycopersici]